MPDCARSRVRCRAANATVVLYHTTWRKDGIASNDAWDHMTALSQAIAIQAVEAVTREEVNYELALEIEAPGVPEGIIRAANDRRASIIVMAYSSRNIRGSKAEVVAKKTNIPLLIAGNGFEAGTFPAPATTAKPPTNIAPPAPPPPAVSPWLGVKRVMAIAIALTVLKAVAKIWLGRSIGSSAIVADGAHSMSDAVPDLLVMWIALLAGRMANRSYPLGRGNLNTIITLGTGITLTLVCLNVAWNILLALYQVATHQYASNLKLGPRELPYAIVITLLSAAISFAVGSYQVYAGKRTREPGVAADGAEMKGDGLIELATFGGLVGAYLFKAPWVEHLIAAFILYFVSGTAKEFLVDGIRGLTQKSLGAEIEEKIMECSSAIHGVARVGTLKTFAVGGTTAVVMLKIETIRDIETAIVQDAVRREISELFAKHEDFGRSEIWIEEAERSPTYRIAIAVSGSRIASRLSDAESVWICEVEGDETISSVNAVALGALPLAGRAALLERKKARDVVTFFTDDNDRAALEMHNVALRSSATFFPGALLYA